MGFSQDMLHGLRRLQEKQQAFLRHGRSQLPHVESHRQPGSHRLLVPPDVARHRVRGPRGRRLPRDAAEHRRGGLRGVRLGPRRRPLHRHLRHRPRRPPRLHLRLSGAAALEGADDGAYSTDE